MICKNRDCKHNDITNNRCAIIRKVKLDCDGKCECFDKGFFYYIDLVYNKLHGCNFIPSIDLNMDTKIGLYFVMKIFDLGFSEFSAGPIMGRGVMLKDKAGGSGLKTADILKRPVNGEVLKKLMDDFDNRIIPNGLLDPLNKPKVESQPFGWLSPTGEFTEGDWGDHEQIAYNIIKEKNFRDEWDRYNSGIDTARDFLSEVKGYALIHNPAGYGEYIVSHIKPLTKRQKDFLYGYFIDMGDSLMANKYAQE